MKLLNLEITAFGPFKDKQIIDFESFCDNSLFLISGKTGSGKTTIFDAISYALFGETTGEYKKEESLRSQYASDNVDTEVKLLFSSNNHKYEITRKPSYLKPGRKTFTTPVATLVNVDENNLIAEKKTKVDSKVIEILDFNFTQFKQIMVLPQGEFIKILNSNSKDREVLLSNILNTNIYSKIQEKLKEENQNLDLKLKNIKDNQAEILKKYNVLTIEELKLKKDSQKEEYNRINDEFEKLNNNNKVLELNIKMHEENNKKILDYNKMEEELANLLKNESKYKASLEEQNKLELLNQISKVYKDYNNLNTELTDYNSKLEENFNNMSSINPFNKNTDELNKILEESRNDLLNYNLEKEGINSNIIKYQKASKDIKQFSIDERDYEIKIEELNKQKKELNNNIKASTDNKEKLEKLRDEYNHNNISELNDVIRIIKNNINLKIKEKKANKEVSDLEKTIEDLKNRLSLLISLKDTKKKLYDLLDLAKYATSLKEGKMCPLCGSIHHPKPLEVEENTVTKEEIDEIDSNINDLKIEITKNEENIKTTNLNIIKYASEIDTRYTDSDLDKYEKLLQTALEEKKEYDEAIREIIKLNSLLELQTSSLAEIESNHAKTTNYLSSIKTNIVNNNNIILEIKNKYKFNEIEELEDKLNIIKNNIEEKITNNYNLEKLINDINILNNSINSCKDNIERINRSIIENKKLLDEFKHTNPSIEIKELTNADILNLKEFKAYCQEYENEKTKLESSLRYLKNNISDFELVNIEDLNKELNDSLDQFKNVKTKRDLCLTKKNALENDYRSYINIEKSSKDEIEQFEMINELYYLASGQVKGGKKINLQTYVLSKILDDILLYANNYLSNFTQNRYILEQDSDSSKGLELLVLDNYTALTRKVGSLSGGETFMACLALALGMSEYISNTSGGISLENIFVDEGFGALDSEALDKAIETLMELACNGKTIGIISHIDEIKTRVSQVIEVNKTKQGSKIII